MLARAALRTCVCRRPEFPLLALVAGSGTRRLFFTCALGSRMRAKVFPEPGLDSRGWHGYMRASVGLAGRGCVAQLVEQLTLNQRVHSSILCTPTKFRKKTKKWPIFCKWRSVAMFELGAKLGAALGNRRRRRPMPSSVGRRTRSPELSYRLRSRILLERAVLPQEQIMQIIEHPLQPMEEWRAGV